MTEPLIHSHITDCLPAAHPLANEQVSCRKCDKLVHAFNNECMTTWVETGRGPFCLPCFLKKGTTPNGYGVLTDSLGLP